MFPMPGNGSFEWNGFLKSVSQKRLGSKRTIVVGSSKVVGTIKFKSKEGDLDIDMDMILKNHSWFQSFGI
jgi:hypothetical protein